MKGSIKIDVADQGNGKGLQPVIRVITYASSEDVRDVLLKTFFHNLGGFSSWVKVDWSGVGAAETSEACQFICLTPVGLDDLLEMRDILNERIAGMLAK